jgi:hypothetical protein
MLKGLVAIDVGGDYNAYPIPTTIPLPARSASSYRYVFLLVVDRVIDENRPAR